MKYKHVRLERVTNVTKRTILYQAKLVISKHDVKHKNPIATPV